MVFYIQQCLFVVVSIWNYASVHIHSLMEFEWRPDIWLTKTMKLLKWSQLTRSWKVTGLGLLNTVCDVTLVSWLSEVPSGPTEYGVLVITLTKTCTIKSFSFAGRFRSPSRGTLLCLVTEQEDWCNTIGHGQDKQVMVRIVASSPVLRTPSVC